MKKTKVLFLDIDGTILLPDHTIQVSTIDAIKEIREQGILVFLATGRPLHAVTELLEKLSIDSAIGYNGAYAIHKGKEIFHRPIDGKIIEHFVETVKQHPQDLVLYKKDANLFTDMSTEAANKFINYYDLKHNELYQPEDQNDILSFSIINLTADMEKNYHHEDVFVAQANVPGLRDSYDVLSKGINKGIAIEHILQELKIDPEDAIAFGDGLNDIEMLSTVGKGFAMANSNPDLFKFAKYKTTSVEDHGVYNGLKQLGLVK